MKNSSKVVEFPLSSTKKISIKITKKRMKNIRLRISKSGIVSLSVPNSTSFNFAYEFLVKKRPWIISQLNQINLNISKNCCNFSNLGNVFLLGNSYPLILKPSSKNNVIFDISKTESNFIIYTKNLQQEYVKQIFIKWCKTYFLNFFNTRLQQLYTKIFSNNNYPLVKIKAMKSMWGNCNFCRRIITLNLYLCKTPIECIDYVIIHELVHLSHPNHSKDFYNQLSIFMPDWKNKKNKLNNYCLQF